MGSCDARMQQIKNAVATSVVGIPAIRVATSSTRTYNVCSIFDAQTGMSYGSGTVHSTASGSDEVWEYNPSTEVFTRADATVNGAYDESEYSACFPTVNTDGSVSYYFMSKEINRQKISEFNGDGSFSFDVFAVVDNQASSGNTPIYYSEIEKTALYEGDGVYYKVMDGARVTLSLAEWDAITDKTVISGSSTQLYISVNSGVARIVDCSKLAYFAYPSGSSNVLIWNILMNNKLLSFTWNSSVNSASFSLVVHPNGVCISRPPTVAYVSYMTCIKEGNAV